MNLLNPASPDIVSRSRMVFRYFAGERSRSIGCILYAWKTVRTNERIGDDVGQRRIGVVNGKWVTKPSGAEPGQ